MLKRKGIILVFILGFYVMLIGCQNEQIAVDKVRDLEFTVVEEIDIPKELKDIIEEKKKEPFKLSYANAEYLYIVTGYGEQATGGYSIAVEDLYETDNTIAIDTTLLGPSKEEKVENALTYPYVVVKLEFIDKNVVFE